MKNDDSYKYDVDETFFNKLLNKINNKQKLLSSGNIKVKYTNESISSMWKRTIIKAAFFDKLEKFTNLFVKTKEIKKNKYEPLVVGKEDSSKIIEETTIPDVVPIIPKAISKTVKYNAESTEETKE